MTKILAAALVSIGAPVMLTACASMSFTPEGICRNQGLAVPSPEYSECVSRTYSERRREWWSDPQNMNAIAAGVAAGLAANGGWVPAAPPDQQITRTSRLTVGERPGLLNNGAQAGQLSALQATPGGRSSTNSQRSALTSPVPSLGLCPDGSFVGSGRCYLAPNGVYVAGPPQIAPDGSYVGGPPLLAPNGRYVGGTSVTLCPDGTYVGGTRCVLAPNGRYVGQ